MSIDAMSHGSSARNVLASPRVSIRVCICILLGVGLSLPLQRRQPRRGYTRDEGAIRTTDGEECRHRQLEEKNSVAPPFRLGPFCQCPWRSAWYSKLKRRRKSTCIALVRQRAISCQRIT